MRSFRTTAGEEMEITTTVSPLKKLTRSVKDGDGDLQLKMKYYKWVDA